MARKIRYPVASLTGRLCARGKLGGDRCEGGQPERQAVGRGRAGPPALARTPGRSAVSFSTRLARPIPGQRPAPGPSPGARVGETSFAAAQRLGDANRAPRSDASSLSSLPR
jgi:hypothetical protein